MTDLMNPTLPSHGQQTASRLVATDGRELPLTSCRLHVTAGGGLCRTRLVQRFRNRYDEPLSLIYQLPLPADGAVAGFAFTIGARRIQGEIDKREAARERFERAIVAGHTAALLEQDRDSVFRQEIGNVPPGAEVIAEIEVDQPLAWIVDGEVAGMWEYRFPTTLAPRYLGGGGTPVIADANRQVAFVAEHGVDARLELDLLVVDRLVPGPNAASRTMDVATPISPSHALRSETSADGVIVRFAEGNGSVRLDRDVVVRWPVAAAEVGVRLERAARADRQEQTGDPDSAFGMLTLVPPKRAERTVARDLTLLIDTSGSMSGRPLQQAIAVAEVLVASLGEQDRLSMVEFSNSARRWHRKPRAADARQRDKAIAWLRSLRAKGCTEMLTGVREALAPLRIDAQTQVVLLTDGLIGFEQEVTGLLMRELPATSRFHVIGVGEAANRALTRSAARAGRGTEAVVGIDDDAALAARRILAAVDRPIVVDVKVSGSALLEVAPERAPDLFGGQPTRLALRLRREGGELIVTGRTADGAWLRTLDVPPTRAGEGRRELVTSFARERVADLEAARAATPRVTELDRSIEALGLAFGIATRHTSWIAVSEMATVDPQQPSRREVQPHELPHGMSVAGLGLRASLQPVGFGAAMAVCEASMAPPPAGRASKEASFASKPKRAKFLSPRAQDDDAEVADGGFGGDDSRAQRPPSAPQPVPPVDSPPVAHFEVHLRRCRDGEWWFELTCRASGVVWQTPQTVVLRFADGTTQVADVVSDASTASGDVALGAIVRLVVRCPDPRTDCPASLILHDGAALPVHDAR